MRLLLAGDDAATMVELRGAAVGAPAPLPTRLPGRSGRGRRARRARPAGRGRGGRRRRRGAAPPARSARPRPRPRGDRSWRSSPGPAGAFGAAAARRLRALVDRRDAARRARPSSRPSLPTWRCARRRDDDAAALDTLRRLAMAAEYRDDNTHEHTERVGDLAARLARHLGHDDRTVWLVRQAAPLHDLGKIAVPDTVLLKPGSLTSEEFEVVKTHAVLGARVLAGSESELLRAAERVGALAPRALGRQRLPRRPGRRGDPARGPARARRRRVRRARARAAVQGVVDRRGGGGGDPARRGHAVRPRGRATRSRRSAPPPGSPSTL